MKKAATTLMVMSLVGNIVPVFNIAAICGLFPLYLVNRQPHEAVVPACSPRVAKKWLLVSYSYWIASYLATGASLSNFFSFDFLRFDGALLIAYAPLLLVIDLKLHPQFVRRLLAFFLTVMSLVALLGLAEFVDVTVIPLGLSALPEPLQLMHDASLSAHIFHGFFRAHNAAGAAYAMAALIALSFLTGGERPSLLSWPHFWLVANVAGLLLTQSRTAYVAFFAAALLMFFTRTAALKNALKYGSPVLLPLLCFLLLQPTFSHRTEEVSDLEDPNVVVRFLYYQRALHNFAESPLVGIGFGRFNDDLKTYSGVSGIVYFATSGLVVNDDSHAHNSYLHFLAEGGITGLALMLGVWITVFRWVRRQEAIFQEGSFGYCLAQGIQACIVLEFFMSFTEHMMGTAVSSLTIFTMLSLLLNLVGWKFRLASLLDPYTIRGGGQQLSPISGGE
jgi:O-antigen ligase